MEICFLVDIALFLVVVTLIALKLFGSNALYVMAIGCAIAGNVYNIDTLSMNLWGMVFGIDSIAYTVFIFCVFLMQWKYGKKDAFTLTYCTIGSICLTGLFRFVADWISVGIDTHIIWGFLSYLVSAFATFIAILVCSAIYERLKIKLKSVINLILYVIIGNFINSFVYFGLMALFTLTISTNLTATLFGSYIGKTIALVICLIAFIIYEKKFSEKEVKGENNE
ncbi:MAG: hypothetical protein ACI4TX_01425 [Christensenellales bacterium]